MWNVLKDELSTGIPIGEVLDLVQSSVRHVHQGYGEIGRMEYWNNGKTRIKPASPLVYGFARVDPPSAVPARGW
jgi:hypothetical protein